MSARGVTQIQHADSSFLGESIAGVNRVTGVLYINVPLIKSMGLTEDMIFFILLHESAHVILGSSDEIKVDEYAHREYLRRKRSMSQSVYAITRILKFTKDEDYVRAYLQLARAKKHDEKYYRK